MAANVFYAQFNSPIQKFPIQIWIWKIIFFTKTIFFALLNKTGDFCIMNTNKKLWFFMDFPRKMAKKTRLFEKKMSL